MMIDTLWTHPRFTVKKAAGTYGPKHDPYSYEEVIVVIGRHTVKYHEGIGTYIDVNGVRSEPPRYLTESEARKASRLLFQALVGYSLEQIERFNRRLEARRPKEPMDPYWIHCGDYRQ